MAARMANKYLLLIFLPVIFKAGNIDTHARRLFSMVVIWVFSGVQFFFEGGHSTVMSGRWCDVTVVVYIRC